MALLKLTVTLMCFAATSATQTEPEQVDLSNVNDFFTSEMVQKRFIVQSVIQVLTLFLYGLKGCRVRFYGRVVFSTVNIKS